jgi:hypothetical protein
MNTLQKTACSPKYVALHNSPPTHPINLTQEAILNQAPTNCQALFIWYEYEGTIPHYTAWIKAANKQLYDCESIAYAATGRVKKLKPQDWTSLKGTIYCLVTGDPYKHGHTNGSTSPSHAKIKVCL